MRFISSKYLPERFIHALQVFVLLLVFISCKKDKKPSDVADTNPPPVKTYNFHRTFSVWDSVPTTPAVLNNYKFKITIFKNNQPDKIIYSTNNKVFFENFPMGKYDMMIEDSLNNFAPFRDTVSLDTCSICDFNIIWLIKYPDFNFKRYSWSDLNGVLRFVVSHNPLTNYRGYCVYFNNKNSLDDSPKKRLYYLGGNNFGAMSTAYPGNDTLCGFTIIKQNFEQQYNFHSGDSLYLFVVPAVNLYFDCSYIRDYSVGRNQPDSYSKNYTAINKSKALTIPLVLQ
jgi:hypothetical protein